jgi:hypothetical protein
MKNFVKLEMIFPNGFLSGLCMEEDAHVLAVWFSFN